MTLTGGMVPFVLIIRMLTIFSRVTATPPFAGLRRFPEGQGFKQWTGDDSKALMKVCITPLYTLDL
jgi:hypothetical protein